nr:pyrroline-5-carboxylate reductase [Eisenbergiella massiliensis]
MRRQGSAAEDENNAAGKRTEGGSNQEGANMTIGFIGLGNMARAVIGGMLDKGIVKPEDICGSAKTEATRKKMEDSCKIRTASSNREVAEQAEILVLAVKPQFFEEVIEEIKGISWEGKTIISLAPGKTIAWLQEKFGQRLPVVRCMPNTPALVGEGCTGVCASPEVGSKARDTVLEILGSFGKAVEVSEKMMDVVGAVSGSSPAFVFLFIEALADGAVAEGMPRAQAYEFAAQAVLGSAKLVLETGSHPGELKDMVCSPGGTTIQGIKMLEKNNFRGTVMDAVITCVEKSRKM